MANKKNIKNDIDFGGADFDIDEERINHITSVTNNDEPINCLKKEKVIVRHIDRQTDLVKDKKHLLYGGMARDAVRSFGVPKYANGYDNFLTIDEQRYLEQAIGLKEGDLNPQKTIDNFWNEKFKNGFNRVTLHRTDTTLDLSIPKDYIAYKILLANKAIIAPSQQVLETRPRATYQFVLISENTDATNTAIKVNNKKQAWMLFGKIQDDADRMRVALSLLQKKQVSPTTKIGFLQELLSDYVDNDTKKFLSIVQDKYFDTKVLIQKAVDRGIVVKRGTYYYDKETNTPLCENGEDPTIGNACKYLNAAKNDGIKFSIEAKIAEK